MKQKFFYGSFHGNNNLGKMSVLENHQSKSKETTFKITEYWEVWDVQVRKLKETISMH